jgi:hypothetical protein
MTFLSKIVALKRAGVTLKKKFCPEKEECGPEKGLLWRRGRMVLLLLLLLLLLWCSKHFCSKQE